MQLNAISLISIAPLQGFLERSEVQLRHVVEFSKNMGNWGRIFLAHFLFPLCRWLKCPRVTRRPLDLELQCLGPKFLFFSHGLSLRNYQIFPMLRKLPNSTESFVDRIVMHSTNCSKDTWALPVSNFSSCNCTVANLIAFLSFVFPQRKEKI